MLSLIMDFVVYLIIGLAGIGLIGSVILNGLPDTLRLIFLRLND